ncbi:MAG: hypothetical protein WAO57_08350 [Syntrophomonadaceae bacterium]|jgi:hypothetical protein|nr:hypothetical protein [Syntrophomonadaceae bacterium]NLE27586.1 hypothetical protein [Clostridiaceae bacterium]
MQVILSQHAKQRCSTRAIKNKHIELALQYGTIKRSQGKKVYALLQKDMIELMGDNAVNHQELKKLNSFVVVCDNNDVITAYNARTKKIKKLLRSNPRGLNQ